MFVVDSVDPGTRQRAHTFYRFPCHSSYRSANIFLSYIKKTDDRRKEKIVNNLNVTIFCLSPSFVDSLFFGLLRDIK